MKVIKLTPDHKELVISLFSEEFRRDMFVETYLTNLNNYHAYGTITDAGEITSLLGFYESNDDASWYWTYIKTTGNKEEMQRLLDKAIEHNEANGRFKFYSMFSRQHDSEYRKLACSPIHKKRYNSVDEFYVPERQRCIFNLPWQILYNRTLGPGETVVRCTFLKQKYRTEAYNAGRL
jgi:hypothetical protein